MKVFAVYREISATEYTEASEEIVGLFLHQSDAEKYAQYVENSYGKPHSWVCEVEVHESSFEHKPEADYWSGETDYQQ